MTILELLTIALIGFLAGLLGGMLGIGGSIIMIPGLMLLFHDADPRSLHIFQAAALAVSGAIAIPAALEQRRKGAVRRDLYTRLLPAAAVAVVAGVLLANATPVLTLRRAFAAFLLFVASVEILKVFRRHPDHDSDGARFDAGRSVLIGAVMGLISGTLGVGGGVVSTPLTQRLCRLPLRQAIAASSAVMAITAPIGAGTKFLTLSHLGLSAGRAALIGLALAPTAILGAPLGVRLAHALPLAWVRGALAIVLLISAWRMSGL